jgi:GT2 family glycosyltransferase
VTRSQLDELAPHDVSRPGSSLTQRIAASLRRATRRACPHGTRRGAVLSTVARTARSAARSHPSDEYVTWLNAHEPDGERLQTMRSESRAWVDPPLVSVLMPVCGSDVRGLDQAIASLAAQAYERWELSAIVDRSASARVRRLLRKRTDRDARVRVVWLEPEGGIAKACNHALELTNSDLVAFVGDEHLLRPHALWAAADHLRTHATDGAVYSDEDSLIAGGQRGRAFFKGDFSSDLLLSTNYVGEVIVARRDLVDQIGGLRESFEGSRTYDLVLRLAEHAPIGHIPSVLHTARASGRAATGGDAQRDRDGAAMGAITDSLERRGTAGQVMPGHAPLHYSVRYTLHGLPRVSIIIPTRDRCDLLRVCLQSIEAHTEYTNYEIVIVDNDSREPETLNYLVAQPHRVLRHPGDFNYSRIMNDAVGQTDSGYIVLLNNDIEVLTPIWLTAMLEHGQSPDVGAVGARLLFPDGRVQHEGIRVGGGVVARNLDHGGYFGLGRCIRDVSAATGACLLLRRDVYEQVGGFDENIRVVFNDVDLCLRIRQAGYRIVYQPLAELTHHELASRGNLNPPEDVARFIERWGPVDTLTDPFVSPHIAGFNPLTLRW